METQIQLTLKIWHLVISIGTPLVVGLWTLVKRLLASDISRTELTFEQYQYLLDKQEAEIDALRVDVQRAEEERDLYALRLQEAASALFDATGETAYLHTYVETQDRK
jgi:hypothetical protein